MQCPPVRQVEGNAHPSHPGTKGHENDAVSQLYAYLATPKRMPKPQLFAQASTQCWICVPVNANTRVHCCTG